jgi:hypothetical protein
MPESLVPPSSADNVGVNGTSTDSEAAREIGPSDNQSDQVELEMNSVHTRQDKTTLKLNLF